MIALSEIGSEDAYSTAEAIVATGDVMSRKAALKLMARFKERAIASAMRLLKERDEAAARSGAELLGLVGSDAALNELGKLLFDPSAGVRAQAVQGLAGRCPEGYRASFNNMQNDPHPVVRALARRLKS
jgi:HEAT repeat protein